jgi:hypothetical protein
MFELESLRPTELRRVIDVVREAGIDVSDWANWAGGTADAARNPRYCYEWSFVELGRVVLLNCWYSGMREHRSTITLQDNLRASAALHRSSREGGNQNWGKRAERFDEAVRMAWSEKLPVRVAICDGMMRKRGDLNARASKVRARQLDPSPWAVTAYDMATGQFTLTRGALAHRLVDQFNLGVIPESPTETRSIKGIIFVRDAAVRKATLSRANGRCEWCQEPGFTTHDGSVFLETHHIVPLSEGGADAVTNVVALCPNHHREAHVGAARDVMRDRLLALLRASLAGQ